MSAEYNKEIIRRWIEEGWNCGNLDIADELYSVDFAAEPMMEGEAQLRGIEAIKEQVREMRAAFPDLHFTVEHLIAEGDTVVGAFHIKGTHQGQLWGMPPTGKRVSFRAIDIWRFRGGKIAERPLAVADFLRALQQVGVVPRLR